MVRRETTILRLAKKFPKTVTLDNPKQQMKYDVRRDRWVPSLTDKGLDCFLVQPRTMMGEVKQKIGGSPFKRTAITRPPS